MPCCYGVWPASSRCVLLRWPIWMSSVLHRPPPLHWTGRLEAERGSTFCSADQEPGGRGSGSDSLASLGSSLDFFCLRPEAASVFLSLNVLHLRLWVSITSSWSARSLLLAIFGVNAVFIVEEEEELDRDTNSSSDVSSGPTLDEFFFSWNKQSLSGWGTTRCSLEDFLSFYLPVFGRVHFPLRRRRTQLPSIHLCSLLFQVVHSLHRDAFMRRARTGNFLLWWRLETWGVLRLQQTARRSSRAPPAGRTGEQHFINPVQNHQDKSSCATQKLYLLLWKMQKQMYCKGKLSTQHPDSCTERIWKSFWMYSGLQEHEKRPSFCCFYTYKF